mgnify:CR=1 FL=1
MSEEDKSSKTEEPTEKKLRDARKKGDVPQSRETGTAMLVFALLMILIFVLPSSIGGIVDALQRPLLGAGVTAIGTGGTGQLTQKMRDKLVGVQMGTAPDPHGWVMKLD